jgi:hypothetical protein
MNDSLQNAKLMRECEHKEILLNRFIVTNEDGLEFAICKKCYNKLRHLKGLTFRHGSR